MARIIARPSELDLESLGRRDYWVGLEHDSIWGEHLIPLTVIVGPDAEPGKGLIAFGGTHGNEYEGPMAIKALLSQIKEEEITGRLIFVPVLNAAAFAVGARDSAADDGVNLNRAFVDGAGMDPATAGITHRIARFVRECLWPHVHVVIDLHAGGNVARFALCATYHPPDDPAQSELIEQTAQWFGMPLVVTYQNRTPGLLTSDAEKLGKITIGAELGWGGAVNAAGVRYAKHGIIAAAIHHEQMTGTIQPIGHHADGTQRKVAIVDAACFTPAPFDGHFEPIVECGESVKGGQPCARLHNFDRIDEPALELRAPFDGIVVAQAWLATVQRGQHVLVIGKAC